MKKSLMLSVLFFLFNGTTSGTIYYVDNTCSNNGNGLAQACASSPGAAGPFNSIGNVQNAVTGDQHQNSVYLKAGDHFREQYTVGAYGTASGAFTIGSYGNGPMPIVDGSDLIGFWSHVSGNVYQASVITQPNRVFFDGAVGIMETSLSALTAEREWYWEANVLYVYSSGGDPGTVYANPGVEAAARNVAVDIGLHDYVVISGIHATKSNSPFMGGFVINGNHVTVSENLSDYNVSAGIRVWDNTTQGILITGNETAYNGQGIYSWRHSAAPGHEVIVQYNNVHDNTSVNGIGDGIFINANYWIVQYNWLRNNGDEGADCLGIHIYSTDTGPGWGRNNIVRYNLVSGQKSNFLDGSGIELDKYTSDNQVYYNVVTGSYGPGIDIYDSSNVSIYGNSLYGNHQNADFPIPAEITFAGPLGLLTGAICRNNAVYAAGSGEYAVYMDSETASHAPQFTSNLWYAPISWNWYYNGAPGNSLPAWNALSYVGMDNYADPLFSNAPGNLSLQSGSPAVDTGTNLGSTYQMGLAPGSSWPSSVSLLNQSNYGTGWEVGAYVKGGNSALSITTSSLPDGTENAAYSATLAASGGTTPYTWSISSGSLPSGLTLSTSGVISGTPSSTGTSNFTAQATDAAAQTATQALSITVGPPPSFDLSAASGTLNVTVNSSSTDSITVTPSGGYTGSVNLTLSGLPRWTNASFSPDPISITGLGSGTSVLTVSTNKHAQQGTYPLTITATSDSLTSQIPLALVIGSASADFSLSASPSSQTVTQGSSTSYGVTVTASGEFSGTVGFSVSGLPIGTGASFSPNTVSGSGSTTMSITTTGTTPTGNYPLTITGTSNSLIHTTSVTLVVNVPSSGDFSISASPGNVTSKNGSPANYSITISSSGGFSNDAALSVTGMPSGANLSFSQNPIVGGSGSSTLSVTTSGVSRGNYTLTITGTSGALVHSASVGLKVH